MKSLILKMIAAGAAGLIAWAIIEPLKPQPGTVEWQAFEVHLIAAFGCLVGLVVGGYDGYSRGGKVHLSRGLGLGCILGGLGALLGYAIAGNIVDRTVGQAAFQGGNIIVAILARTAVFTCMGILLGAAIGASSLTVKRAVQGAIGGGIGGFIGGASFDLIGIMFAVPVLAMQNQSSGEVGGPSRAVAFTVLGGAIGLFIGLVEQFTRSAWLRIDYGRNEFKEWSIDSAETYIGRSESATVPLRGDPNIQPIHAVIRKQGHDYVLADGGSQIGTLLNGQYIQQAVLVPGSFIQIGSNVLQFLMKGIPAPVAAPDGPRLQPLGPQSYANPQVATSGVYGSPQPQTAYPATPHQAPAVQPNPYPSAAPTPQPSNQTVAYSSPVGFSLVVLDGPLSGQRFPVNSNLEIGREGAQVRLTGDANASRRHAMVAPSTGSVRVTDLGSTNGTFINGQRLPAGDARPGDILKIGGTNFRVEAG